MSRPECLAYEPLALPPPADTASCVLDLQMQEQQMPEWCWAAVSASLHDLFAHPESPTAQCGVVNRALSSASREGADACSVPTPESCDKPWYLELGLKAVGIHAAVSPGGLTFDHIVPRVAAGTPPCALLSWMRTTQHEHGGGHFVTLYGYGPEPGDAPRFVAVGDPLYGDTVIDLADFPGKYHGGAAWSQSYDVSWTAPVAGTVDEIAS